jgi:signal transduction histidine kinase/DNA-binding response OmpR family regulator
MILIVDDKQENIFSLKIVLEQHGFSTDSALSGEEALKKLLKNEYALVILDVQMPGMDGFEVAEAISGLNKTKDIPVIFLSAVNTHKKFVTKGFESGGVDYLTKPVDADILMLKVRNFYRLYEKTRDLKNAEKALTATVKELHSTLEALPQMAFTANSHGDLETVNHSWLEYAASEQEFPECPPDQPSLTQQWLQATRANRPVEMEVQIRNQADGHYYYHLLRATPVMGADRISRWVGTFTNIHEQKRLNETLERLVEERTRKLVEANRELEISNHDLQQFTSVASHDLKEPLRKIQFFGNLLKDKGAVAKDMVVHLDKIIRSSNRMSNLINDLLSFASLSQSNPFQRTDINGVIQDILFDLELSIQEKEARFEIGEIPPLDVIPGLVRQLFQNLISNALKFTRPGVPPFIRITAEEITIPSIEGVFIPGKPYCRIAITDNGIGFEEKYSDRIFTLFQRLNGREEYEGTGIGLAIAKKIVEKHNGSISASSDPGKGATFIVTLPVEQEGTPQNTPSTLTKSHHS